MTRTELYICRSVGVFSVVWLGLFILAESQAPSGENWFDEWDLLPLAFFYGWLMIAPVICVIAGVVGWLIGRRVTAKANESVEAGP